MEIERKFRVTWIDKSVLHDGIRIEQAYLSLGPEVRIRLREQLGYLTIKGKGDLARDEFDYPIPEDDVRKLFAMKVGKAILKLRYEHERWEVDVFGGHLEGLLTAEIELSSLDEVVERPKWFKGYEITYDPRYKNKQLAMIDSVADLEEALSNSHNMN